jgi:hypothetical protein
LRADMAGATQRAGPLPKQAKRFGSSFAADSVESGFRETHLAISSRGCHSDE